MGYNITMRKLLALLLLVPSLAFAAHTDYYVGDLRTLSSQGEVQGHSLVLTKRTQDPAAKVIIEEVLHLPAQGEPTVLTQVIQVNGNHLTLLDSSKRIRGEGTLHGKAWAWEKWDVEGTVDGNRKFKSRSHLAGGNLLVRKEFYDVAGKLKTIFSEEYRPITQDLYEMLQAKLNHAPAKTPLS